MFPAQLMALTELYMLDIDIKRFKCVDDLQNAWLGQDWQDQEARTLWSGRVFEEILN